LYEKACWSRVRISTDLSGYGVYQDHRRNSFQKIPRFEELPAKIFRWYIKSNFGYFGMKGYSIAAKCC
jgi:hypothetical protein